jgi:hypothetical protein
MQQLANPSPQKKNALPSKKLRSRRLRLLRRGLQQDCSSNFTYAVFAKDFKAQFCFYDISAAIHFNTAAKGLSCGSVADIL